MGHGIFYAQAPEIHFSREKYEPANYEQFENGKSLPESIKPQVLTALSFYPELKDVRIVFRFRETKTPLTSRPQLWSVLKKKKNRTYVITISTSSKETLSLILFHNLPYNAQIGVIGHELGHVVHYNQLSSMQIIGLGFKLLGSDATDAFEYNTDLTTINHGLGYQLLAWSTYVREALHIDEWGGATNSKDNTSTILEKERYMNPRTIQKYINESSLYKMNKG